MARFWTNRSMQRATVALLVLLVAARVGAQPTPTPTFPPQTLTDCYNSIPSNLWGYNPSLYTTVTSLPTATALRASLIQWIWKGAGLPAYQPQTIINNAAVSTGPLATAPSNFQQMNHYVLTLSNAAGTFTRNAYHYIPASNVKDTVVFIHAGHQPAENVSNPWDNQADSDGLGDFARYMVNLGYPVVAMYMPLYGTDTGPVSWYQCTGINSLCANPPGSTIHDQFSPLETSSYAPLEVFLDGEIAVLNYILATYPQYRHVAVSGLSGGAQTTTQWAALDTRIEKSYADAGTLVAGLQTYPATCYGTGDYDAQRLPSPSVLCRGVGMPLPCCTGVRTGCNVLSSSEDQYLLGTIPNRRATQLFSQYDNCCAYGIAYRLYSLPLEYEAARLGGSYQAFLDSSSHQHQFSPVHRGMISGDIAGTRVIDNLDYGFFYSNPFVSTPWVSVTGWESSLATAQSGNGSAVASWTFPALVSGIYDVSMTWPSGGSTSVPYVIQADGATAATGTVNQSTAPLSSTDYGTTWSVLASSVTTVQGSLRVSISNNTGTSTVLSADGVRVRLLATIATPAQSATPTPTVPPTATPSPAATCTAFSCGACSAVGG